MNTVEFHHGAFADSYEKQANAQGFTLGDNAEFLQNIGHAIVALYINSCITDKERQQILQKFQDKMLVEALKPLEVSK